MSAKEMFNALGYYEKDVGYTNILCYEKDVSVPNVPHYIGLQFVLNHEYISIYSHVGGRYEYGKECHYSYGAFNGFDVELLRAVQQQLKELHWLKQPHEKPVYKLTKFEKELLECYSDVYSFKVFNSLNEMKEKGYFKGIDDNELIGDILANCEVVG